MTENQQSKTVQHGSSNTMQADQLQAQSFAPTPENFRSFRNALGQFATGVTVVTCQSPRGPLGIAANSFASVSLDPPLVLWSPAKASKRHETFVKATHFAIHVLDADQKQMCSDFARDGEAFGSVDWAPNQHGVPILSTLAVFECRRAAVHDAGDHSIVIGEVEKATTRPGQPLVFFGGNYGSFSE